MNCYNLKTFSFQDWDYSTPTRAVSESLLVRIAGFNATVKRALRVLRSFLGSIKIGSDEFNINLDVEPEVGSADSGNLNFDLPHLFRALAEAAAARDTAIALIVDEMQYLQEKEFGALITAIHEIAQKQLPLILIGAGLPQLVGLSGRAKSYAERLFDFPKIGPLTDHDAEDALRKPVQEQNVDFEQGAIKEIPDYSGLSLLSPRMGLRNLELCGTITHRCRSCHSGHTQGNHEARHPGIPAG